jgi:hypothetical protein
MNHRYVQLREMVIYLQPQLYFNFISGLLPVSLKFKQ